MQIFAIGQGFTTNEVSFGRKKKTPEQKAQRLAKRHPKNNPLATDPNGYYNKALINGQTPARTVPLDMDRILSLNVPEPEEIKPAPFEETHGKFTLDRYQKEAIDSYNSGNTTIVSAPTGTGKTLIAEHVIKKSLDDGKKIIYLSPLKALSNEKYSDFAKLFGNYDENGNLIDTKNVGLLTGDTSINPDAPLVVMTTEIYKNSLLGSDEKGAYEKYKDYDGVIYDEFHYLGDSARGTIWEESVMYTPKHMKQLMLSATASNSEEIGNWIGKINPEIKTHLVNVPESERHVPLKEFVLTSQNGTYALENIKDQRINLKKLEQDSAQSDRQKAVLEELKETFNVEETEDVIDKLKDLNPKANTLSTNVLSDALKLKGMSNEKAESIALILSDDSLTQYRENLHGEFDPKVKMGNVINLIHNKKMDPALIYIFSKRKCEEEFARQAKSGKSLLTEEQSKRVYDEVKKAQDKGVFLGADFDEQTFQGLMKGYAVHHAGKLPAYKSLVENLARQGLVKACFATETLIAGINMPFKTTVFTQMDKFDGQNVVDISTSSFKQGAGRAGRRGKDDIGNVIVIPKNQEDFDLYTDLTSSKDTSILSQEKPSYASCLSDRMLNSQKEAIGKTLSAAQSGAKKDWMNHMTDNKVKLLKDYGYIQDNEEGKLERTEKGEIAKSVYGINEILMTELLSEPEYLEDKSPSDLIALFGTFADTKDENPKMEFGGGLEHLNDSLNQIKGLVKEIDDKEIALGMKSEEETTLMSTNLVPYIVRFAEAPSDRDEALSEWKNIMDELKAKELINHEGDFLRVINGTKDLLDIVAELSPNENVKENANEAIQLLRKPPVEDVLNYELNQSV